MPKQGRPAGALPPALIFTTALTCGVVAALTLQIYLSRAGFDLAALWESLFASARTTGPWWATAGLAFATGGAVAATLTRWRQPSRRLRLLRWTGAAILVLVLADVGGGSGRPDRCREARGAGSRHGHGGARDRLRHAPLTHDITPNHIHRLQFLYVFPPAIARRADESGYRSNLPAFCCD